MMRLIALLIGAVLIAGGLWSAAVISQGLAGEPAAPSSSAEATGSASGHETGGLPEAAPTLTFTQAVHFVAADGSDLVTEAETYQVDAADSHLTLSAEGRAPLLLDAKPTTHSEKIEAPLAVLVPDDDPDVLHVVLLLANGQALDAAGSLSGTRPRGTRYQLASPYQLRFAVAQAYVVQPPIVTVIDLNGRWTDGSTRSAAISAVGTSLTIDMSAYGRPAAKGSIVNGSTITVTFPDAASYTGTLQPPNTIRWSNGSAWTKVSQQAPLVPTFDVVPSIKNAADDNGILLNPQWGGQKNNPTVVPDPMECHIDKFFPATPFSPARTIRTATPFLPPCTTQKPKFDSTFSCTTFVGKYGGHHNWAPATYEGTIYWQHHSPSWKDDDYNWVLETPAAGTDPNNPRVGVTTVNPSSIKLEADSDETIDHFSTKWWNDFHTAVDADDAATGRYISALGVAFPPPAPAVLAALKNDADVKDNFLRGMIDGKKAIVTGLLGLDCAHNCRSELHPVWAMAIRVNEDPSDETWEIFVRRSGNEGWCSDDQHPLNNLPNDTYTFRLPWSFGASSGQVIEANFLTKFGQASGPMVTFSQSNLAALVSFTLPPPPFGQTGEMLHGELRLRWSGAKKEVPFGAGTMPPIVTTRAVNAPVEREDDAESHVQQLVDSMTPAQRATFMAKFPPKTISKHVMPLRAAGPPTQVPSLPPRVLRSKPTDVLSVPSAEQKAKNQQRLDALHAVYGPNIPGFSPQPK